jgi:hypothetical protein
MRVLLRRDFVIGGYTPAGSNFDAIMYVAVTRARKKLLLSPACAEIISASAAPKAGRGVNIMENEGLETHLWVGNRAREIEIGGKAFVLYHCPRCTWDFAREPDRSGWRAVHVGVHKVHYLHDSLSNQWVSESCPEIPRA